MASASSLQLSISFRNLSSAINKEPLFLGFSHLKSTFALPQSSRPRPILACSRRRRNKADSSAPSTKKNKKKLSRKGVGKEEDLDDDPFEALFQQLAKDLENDESSLDDDDEEITEEELAELERELDKVLEEGEDLMGLFDAMVNDATDKKVKGNVKEEEDEDEQEDGLEEEEEEEENEEEEDYDDDEEEEEEEEHEDELEEDDDDEEDDVSDEEETRVELRRWQLKRLAYALKTGRRKANIKNLAADLCLDRAVVLKLLRDPPPDLLMLSATLPDEMPVETFLEPEIETFTPVKRDSRKLEAKKDVPIHVLRRGWSTQKRIKKVHVETLERVYQRTKRPTGSMVSNIVHVTGLPRRTVVKWFEEKRSKDGVPDHRKPYERPATEPGVFTSS